MRLESKNSFSTNGLFKLKGHDWLNKQREAGRIAAQTLNWLKLQVESMTRYSLIDLNIQAEYIIEKADGIPTFKGYKGFPSVKAAAEHLGVGRPALSN